MKPPPTPALAQPLPFRLALLILQNGPRSAPGSGSGPYQMPKASNPGAMLKKLLAYKGLSK